MKKFISILLALTFCLTLFGCSNDTASLPKPNVSGDNTVLGSDFQKNMNQSTSTRIYNACETDDGYYFEYNCLVYYMDKETGAATILCGKPECSHTDETCNAFVNALFLTYYDGKLYYSHHDYIQENGGIVDKGERLHCLDLDGSNHTLVQALDFVPGGDTNNYLTEPIIHRGSVYFCYSGCLYMVSLGADIDTAVCIYGDEIIDDGSHVISSNELYYELWADGDIMYFMAKNVKQSNGTYKDTLYSYDPLNEKLTKIWEVPNKSEVGTWDTTGVSVSAWYVSGGYLYYYLSGNDFWYAELSTGKNEKFANVDLSHGIAAFSAEYIVVMNKTDSGYVDLLSGTASLTGGDVLLIYNYSGELVKEISLKKIYDDQSGVSECSVLWVESGKVYILADFSNVVINGNTTLKYAIYSVDIESGTVTKEGWSN